MKYTKKPITVDAVQFNGNNHAEIQEFAGKACITEETEAGPVLKIVNAIGEKHVAVGDYVVCQEGQFWVSDPDFFQCEFTATPIEEKAVTQASTEGNLNPEENLTQVTETETPDQVNGSRFNRHRAERERLKRNNP